MVCHRRGVGAIGFRYDPSRTLRHLPATLHGSPRQRCVCTAHTHPDLGMLVKLPDTAFMGRMNRTVTLDGCGRQAISTAAWTNRCAGTPHHLLQHFCPPPPTFPFSLHHYTQDIFTFLLPFLPPHRATTGPGWPLTPCCCHAIFPTPHRTCHTTAGSPAIYTVPKPTT